MHGTACAKTNLLNAAALHVLKSFEHRHGVLPWNEFLFRQHDQMGFINQVKRREQIAVILRNTGLVHQNDFVGILHESATLFSVMFSLCDCFHWLGHNVPPFLLWLNHFADRPMSRTFRSQRSVSDPEPYLRLFVPAAILGL